MSLDNNFLQMGKPATKYHIYSITNFMLLLYIYHQTVSKQCFFLNINPSYMIVLKFHMLLLYIYHQTVSKQCFLVGESRYQSYVYFHALKRHFFGNNHVFLQNFIVNTFQFYCMTLQMKDNDRPFNLIPNMQL